MLITDHIKIFMESPLRGENIPEFGPRFPDASYLYTPRLQELARQQARQGWASTCGRGFTCTSPVPSTRPPPRSACARILGADAVGMSTAPEVITAGHCGMEVLGFTLLLQHGRRHPGPARSASRRCWRPPPRPGTSSPRLVLACLEHLN